MKIISIDELPFHEIRYNSSGPKGQVRRCILPFYRAYASGLPKGVSSIAVTSDLQGREKTGDKRLLGEQVAEELKLLVDLGDIGSVNLVLLAGDLYDYPDCRKLGGTGDVAPVWKAFSNSFPFVVGVHGNHDVVEDDLPENSIVLDGSRYNYEKLIKISGVSGIIGKLSRNQRKSEEQFISSLSKCLSKDIDICLLHEGPDIPEEDLLGNPSIREWLEVDGESLIIFGHCHWDVHLREIGKNQVLNTDAKVFIISSVNDLE